MAESGLSAGEVKSMIQEAIRPVASKTDSLERSLDRLDSRLRKLEAEMSSIADAISSMSSKVTGKLDQLQETTRSRLEVTNDRLAEVRKTTEQGLTRNAEVTAAGFTANTAATVKVASDVQTNTSSVEKNTGALVQMEVMRIFAEGQLAMRRIASFAKEVDERFGKALESVVLNRNLYNKHFESIYLEYDSKLRTIGEHIYRIMEEDFVPVVEVRQTVPPAAYQELALRVDERLVQSRSEHLEANLAALRRDTLQPLLRMHAEFEQLIQNGFALPLSSDSGDELAVAAAISVDASGEVATTVEGLIKEADGEHVRFRIAPSGRFVELANRLQQPQARQQLVEAMNWVALDAPQLASLKQEVAQLAKEGLISAPYAAGLAQYLDQFGLRVAKASDARLAAWR